MRHLQSGLVAAGLISAVVAIAPQAQAASLSGFNDFTVQVTGSPTSPTNPTLNPKKDIFLNSITLNGGKVINQFDLVQDAKIIQNNYIPDGPASSDRGDSVTSCPRAEMPNVANIVASLGNLNLNCIVDTEDRMGNSIIDVFFNPKKLLNTFFLFERGRNSDIKVEGLDKNGNVISSDLFVARSQWNGPLYSIDTLEVDRAQPVGAYGVRSDVRLAGLRLTSTNGGLNGFNGPDFKVVGTQVPEPTTMLGLGVVTGTAWLMRRRKQAKG